MPASRTTISFLDAKTPLFVGVDVGGTNTKIGLVDDLGRTLSFLSIATEEPAGPEAGIRRIGNAVRQMIMVAGLPPGSVARVGLGTPGPLDLATGTLVAPVNMPHWHNFPIRDRLAQACNLPVTYGNDASAAAFAEYWLGWGSVQSLAMFTLGTGIGGGIIVDGKPIDGQHSLGGEYGHAIIDCSETARLCGCGQRGHLEAYASATSVVKCTNEELQSGRKSSLTYRMEQGAPLTTLLLAEEAENGDALALEIVMDTARYMAVGIVNIMHTIDPEIIILGGAMNFGGIQSQLGRRFLEQIRQEVRRRTFAMLADRTKIEFARLESDAGYLGAAGLARTEYYQSKNV
ncbi:MAG TPA: ROK family protein [Pirellulales bacterium]|jgi:glucokinase|nr:ROK family protein [Pirellulales bacterium]